MDCDRDLQKPKKSRKNRLCDSISSHYECLRPQMPNWFKADYESWKIWFEKFFKYLNEEDIVLIWFSLWAMFLMRYLSENEFPRQIHQLHLVAPERKEEWLSGFHSTKKNLEKMIGQCESVTLYHSKDDMIVPYESAERLTEAFPMIRFESFETRGHFIQPAFPELLENIWIYKR